MSKTMKRLLCALAALLLLAGGAWALAGGDSLITLSYLTDTFLPQAMEQGKELTDEPLQEEYDRAREELEELHKDLLTQVTGSEQAILTSPDLRPRDWSDGDVVELYTGSGLLLVNGAATVTHDGVFLDLTGGTEVASGSALVSGHRYLAAEETQAQVTVRSGAAQMGVQGSYTRTDGGWESTPFYDVSHDDWYYEAVNYVYGNELFAGMDDHHFGPDAVMNRAMLMTVLYRMAGSPAEEMAQAAGLNFSDVADDAWYAPYVRWGYAQEVTAGTGPDTFSPDQYVTRQQVITLLYSFGIRYLGLDLSARGDLSAYSDLDQVESWALEPYTWAKAAGVADSIPLNGTLGPRQNAGRAEVAAMLRAFSQLAQN